jgi:hypothetical protein
MYCDIKLYMPWAQQDLCSMRFKQDACLRLFEPRCELKYRRALFLVLNCITALRRTVLCEGGQRE